MLELPTEWMKSCSEEVEAEVAQVRRRRRRIWGFEVGFREARIFFVYVRFGIFIIYYF